MSAYYGQFNDTERHAIAARIWGHRLRAGQHWMEYMLEFLSVLSGFDYQFGQGLADHDGEPNYRLEYRVPKRLGLRRFVFYDGREKTPDPRDQRAADETRRQLRSRLPADAQTPEDLLGQLRSLLRSFSAIEDDRSWYAKSLFPVHEEFLLWEALRKGSTLRRYAGDANLLPIAQLDQGVEFFARNFFARGGELYYLMISAGTEGDRDRRTRIASRFRALLQERNQSLGEFARIINGAWIDLVADPDDEMIEGRLGWLPDPACPFYRQIAEDLDVFLENKLDSLECLELLAHLISFHIVCYIYHRAQPASNSEGHSSGSCLEACRPQLLVDLLSEEGGGVIRDRSAALLRRQEVWQLERARELVAEQVCCWAAQQPDDDALYSSLEWETANYFRVGGTRAKGNYNMALREVRTRYGVKPFDREALIHDFSTGVFSALSSDFRDNFLAVHSKLGRAIGLIAPRKGPRPRFVLGDTLLKTLVIANLRASDTLNFGDLLDRLYDRYGVVVGPGEADKAGLLERLRINEEYYAHNRDALLARMQRAGLVTQYSDATALVSRL
jgi:hypothetical protein